MYLSVGDHYKALEIMAENGWTDRSEHHTHLRPILLELSVLHTCTTLISLSVCFLCLIINAYANILRYTMYYVCVCKTGYSVWLKRLTYHKILCYVLVLIISKPLAT